MMIRIPDGDRSDIYFMKGNIVAMRENHNNPSKTLVWCVGDEDPWVVDCPIETIKTIIPLDQQ